MGERAYKGPEAVPVSIPTSPEKALLIEIFKSAVRDVLNTAPRPRSEEAQFRRNAANWLNSNDEAGAYYFTFVEICDALNLCPTLVRRRIQRAIDNNETSDLFERRSALSYRRRILPSETKRKPSAPTPDESES